MEAEHTADCKADKAAAAESDTGADAAEGDASELSDGAVRSIGGLPATERVRSLRPVVRAAFAAFSARSASSAQASCCSRSAR